MTPRTEIIVKVLLNALALRVFLNREELERTGDGDVDLESPGVAGIESTPVLPTPGQSCHPEEMSSPDHAGLRVLGVVLSGIARLSVLW